MCFVLSRTFADALFAHCLKTFFVLELRAKSGGRPAVRGGPAQRGSVNHVRTER